MTILQFIPQSTIFVINLMKIVPQRRKPIIQTKFERINYKLQKRTINFTFVRDNEIRKEMDMRRRCTPHLPAAKG